MVNIKQQLITSNERTYGRNNKKQYITVHQTGNTSRGANAQAHANLQSNGNARSASWHYSVDDKEAVQSFSHDAQCWHASDGRGDGNLNSIAVELCINEDADYKKAVENGAKLVKKIMNDENIPLENVKQHADWSPKNCPAQIRSGKEGIDWNDFLELVKGGDVSEKKQTSEKSVSQMAQEVIDGKHGNGHSNRRQSLGITQSQYEEVRSEVNRLASGGSNKPQKSIEDMAKEILNGDHGNGHSNRRRSLGISQSEYEKVRAEVNRIAQGGSGKSVSDMADEVIAGKHGNGNENRRRSLNISKSKYEEVRKEVNSRF